MIAVSRSSFDSGTVGLHLSKVFLSARRSGATDDEARALDTAPDEGERLPGAAALRLCAHRIFRDGQPPGLVYDHDRRGAEHRPRWRRASRSQAAAVAERRPL